MSPPARTKRPELSSKVIVSGVTPGNVWVMYQGQKCVFELYYTGEWIIIKERAFKREWRLTKAT